MNRLPFGVAPVIVGEIATFAFSGAATGRFLRKDRFVDPAADIEGRSQNDYNDQGVL